MTYDVLNLRDSVDKYRETGSNIDYWHAYEPFEVITSNNVMSNHIKNVSKTFNNLFKSNKSASLP